MIRECSLYREETERWAEVVRVRRGFDVRQNGYPDVREAVELWVETVEKIAAARRECERDGTTG